LLIFNALACITGFAGVIAQTPVISAGPLIGGGLFLLALIFISISYLHQ